MGAMCPVTLSRWLRVGALLLGLVASALTTPAAAQSVQLEALTSPELVTRIAAGATTAIVPIGGTEQNGPYMTLGKHNVRVQMLATRIAVRLGNALVAPVIAYVPEGAIDPPQAHMRFAGTLTVPAATFESMLTATAESLRRAGFHDVVFLADHGGYVASVERVVATLNQRWRAGPARAHALPEYYRAATTDFAATLKQHGVSAADSGSHAGLADTSLMLALDPTTVRIEAMRGAPAPTAAQGVHGDPRKATAELGALGVTAIVDRSVAAIRAATARH